MRNLIIETIERYRDSHGFDRKTMRWSNWYLTVTGLRHITRKEAKRNKYVHMEDATVEDLNNLTDQSLLNTFQFMIMIMSKQM
jgi:hypothetical protein